MRNPDRTQRRVRVIVRSMPPSMHQMKVKIILQDLRPLEWVADSVELHNYQLRLKKDVVLNCRTV